MKSICFMAPTFCKGGVGSTTTTLANELCKYYNVYILAEYMTEPMPYELDPRITFTALYDRPYRFRELRAMGKDALPRYVRDNGINAVILQTYYMGFIGSVLRSRTDAKLIYCEHCSLFAQPNPKYDIKYIKDRIDACISTWFTHKTVLLNKRMAKVYHRLFGTPKRKLTAIPNCIDTRRPHANAYDTASKRIISAGRFSPEKGFDTLIKAFRAVADKHPDWHLDLYGDGELADDLRALADRLGLSDNLTFMGMCDDLDARYGQYAMYVLPSEREGMPMVLLEAKLNRLPIVSFDILTGPREMVQGGVDGILVPPGDIGGLSEAICRLIEDKELRISMSSHSQDNLDEFSTDTVLSQWKQLLDNI